MQRPSNLTRKLFFALGSCLALLACGEEKSAPSELSFEGACNESKWGQCLVELSMIDRDAQPAKYLSKEIQCKMICRR